MIVLFLCPMGVRKAQEAVHAISPNADVVIHTVPTSEREGILEKIGAAAAREHVSVHNVSVHYTERGVWIDLDLEVDPHLSFESAHETATKLELSLRDELADVEAATKVADINVHIEPRGGDEPVRGERGRARGGRRRRPPHPPDRSPPARGGRRR